MSVNSKMTAIADAIRSKTGGTSALTLDQMATEIGNIRGGYEDIPTYHYAECARVVKAIDDFKKTHSNSLVFGAISDIHVLNADATYEAKSKTSINHASFALETVGAMTECDFIADLGDNCWENGIDTDNALVGAQYTIKALQPVGRRLDCFYLVGNHDTSNSTEKVYDLIGKHNSFDDYGTTQIRGFGYKDYVDKKVRVIILNTCDYWNVKGGCGMSYEQKDFLIRALDVPNEDWQILLLSHIPLDWNGGDYNFYSDLQAILTAFENNTTVTIPVNSSYARGETPSQYATYSNGNLVYRYDFINKPKIIANIHGHVHTNKVSKIVNTDITRVSTANTNPDQNKTSSYPEYGDYSVTADEAARIKKVSGTAKDTSATFYCIDLDEQIIYSYGYGADVDRVIPYKDVAIYNVTYNLSSAVSSNTVVEVIDGATYTTELTVANDYAINTVTVTMGGVDVTSSVYANGVINIPEVTGNITITVTVKDNYIPHWDIADRTAVTDMYKTATQTKDLSRNNYYYGVARTGGILYNQITSCSVSGNNVTFTATAKGAGIGLPYHLESGASYTFSAKANSTGRISIIVLNADGTYISGSDKYSSSGTSLTLDFVAPTDTTQWAMLIVECYTANASITYSDISLVKK